MGFQLTQKPSYWRIWKLLYPVPPKEPLHGAHPLLMAHHLGINLDLIFQPLKDPDLFFTADWYVISERKRITLDRNALRNHLMSKKRQWVAVFVVCQIFLRPRNDRPDQPSQSKYIFATSTEGASPMGDRVPENDCDDREMREGLIRY